MIQRIALGIEYDGNHYHGWQIQPQQKTVAGALERALSRVADAPIKVICAGRTDVGVHAKEQVVHFDTDIQRPLDAWIRGTNTFLAPDVAVQWARIVDETFHARFSAIARSYRYVIYNSPIRSPLYARNTSWYYQTLDHERMAKAAQYLIGTHDFSAFRDSECQAKSPIRTIEQLIVSRDQHFIEIHITANAFLQHMVRNIVGVLLPIGTGEKPPEWAESVLAGRDRKKGGVTAKSAGLTLMSVRYPETFDLPVSC